MIDVNEVAKLAKQADIAKSNPAGGRPYVVVDGSIVYLEQETPAPARAKGTFEVSTVESFVQLANELAATPVEGSPRIYQHGGKKPRFVAVLNDHGVKIGHRDFRINFVVPFSTEWGLWDDIDRAWKDQDTFATFLEENMADVSTPPGADLLALVLAFEETRTMVFKSAKRLQDGSQQIVMASTADAAGGASMKLPANIMLRMPVIESEQPRSFVARLKYRVQDQKLKFTVEIAAKHRVIRAALNDAATAITDGTGHAIIVGGE